MIEERLSRLEKKVIELEEKINLIFSIFNISQNQKLNHLGLIYLTFIAGNITAILGITTILKFIFGLLKR